ncbi:MAG: hypothetical protein GX078_00080 [Clostridiales bacterium]|nr:hypothetical protein [Clostridiales bacterium]
MYDDDLIVASGIWAVLAVIGLFILVIVLLTYVLFAIGLAKIMKAKGMDDRYRAWIPFWNSYVLGSIIEEEIGNEPYVFEGTKWIFAFGGLAAGVIANMIPFVGALVPLALYVYIIVCCAVMAKKYGTMVSVIITSIIGLPGIGFIITAGKMEGNSEPFGSGFASGSAQEVQSFNTNDYSNSDYSNTSFADGAKSEPEEVKNVEFETEKNVEAAHQETVAPLQETVIPPQETVVPTQETVATPQDSVAPSYNVGASTDGKENK